MEHHSWHDNKILYTANVYLTVNSIDEKSILSFVNIPGTSLPMFKKVAYTEGVVNRLSTGVIQLISPFQIKTIVLIPQKENL